ncbi:MAG: transcriptional regulator [Microbacterium sp.]|jgi:DNA-binding transcriptional MerR regulator|uniref:MerR family transcriptional regulator n=1 Tax=Microbacterium sp. TaxID=51671 RepID=UPI002603A917|nr:MerR family transcriptional regulator [Microbacterium sp.]MDF2559223.1 transcriptional regulator [Microbacterium sp.]
MPNPQEQVVKTAVLGRRVGYSTQQVRDLERLGVIPPAERDSNGYRRYGARHETAARAYRSMAAAIGPVPARRLMPTLIHASVEHAAERIDELHVGLAQERSRVREALRGLDVALAEADDDFDDADAMTIGELAQALGIRPSALRHWEREGLVHPLRGTASTRSYGSAAITEARIVAALRAGGYGIPAISRILGHVRQHADTAEVQRILQDRLVALTRRSVALLAAAGHLHALLADRVEGN